MEQDFHGDFQVNFTWFFASFSGFLDWIVLILVWFERSLHSAQVSGKSCPWPLKLMTSQRVERTWIRTGGYGRFRGEWVKIETFSGRRRPDWKSKPGTEAAVAFLQNSNIKIAVNLGGRRLGKLQKDENMALHKELRELMFICLHATTMTRTNLKTTLSVSIPTLVRGITYYSKQFSIRFIFTIL